MSKKAINVCAQEAEEIKYLPNNTVLISINPTYDNLFPLQLDRNSNKILTVKFDDVTDDKEYKGVVTKRKMNYDTALKILDFINIHQEKDFIIHCAAGISRSAAICLYLNIFHNHELKPNFWKTSKPNKYVLGQLIVARMMN